MISHNIYLGKKGERLAKKFLKRKNLKFIKSNFTYKKKEVDLIFEDVKNKTLIFVEVKTRLDDSFASPEDNINNNKIKNYQFLIQNFILKFPKYKDFYIRVDSISIIIKGKNISINHIEGINVPF